MGSDLRHDQRLGGQELEHEAHAGDDLIARLEEPLAAIHAAAETLYDNPGLPERSRERFLAVIVAESTRAARLLDACGAVAQTGPRAAGLGNQDAVAFIDPKQDLAIRAHRSGSLTAR